jgi:hypothetical protein
MPDRGMLRQREACNGIGLIRRSGCVVERRAQPALTRHPARINRRQATAGRKHEPWMAGRLASPVLGCCDRVELPLNAGHGNSGADS